MQEPAGKCSICQKEIICLDGFLYGIVKEDGQLICFDCDQTDNE